LLPGSEAGQTADLTAMPVTIRPSDRTPQTWGRNPSYRYPLASSSDQLLSSTVSDESTGYRSAQSSAETETRHLVQSSFDSLSRDDNIYAAKNGLVHACIEAYNHHHNLILRPDDVWFAILSQLGIHINASSASLGGILLADPGQQGGNQHLHIEIPLTPKTDHGELAFKMTKLLGSRMRYPWMRDWIMPKFTTTSKTDEAVASVLFMGAMQKFFTYSWGTRCGIPSVTLLGEVDDWLLIHQRCADALAKGKFGAAAAAWGRVLQPVLASFVDSFLNPEGRDTMSFWGAICAEHAPNGSGTTTYSGWITAFCYWDEKGRCLHGKASSSSAAQLVSLARSDVPMGFTKVPVTLLENGAPIKTEMVAGSVGIKVRNLAHEAAGVESESPSGLMAAGGSRKGSYDTIQPESGWFLYRV